MRTAADEMETNPVIPQTKKILYAAAALATCFPFVSAPLGLFLGIGFGLTFGSPWPSATGRLAKRLLQLSIIGLGFGLAIGQVLEAGRSGLLYTIVGISATMAAGLLLGRVLEVRRNTATLISFGTAICGGSAIAAMAPVVQAEEGDIAVSLATVFTLNAVALLLFPIFGHALGLTQRQFGFWAALAIHDTSSVVGAGAAYGTAALALATTVKLARAAWIVPITLGAGWLRRSRGKAVVPWFLVGFVAASALRSAFPLLHAAWEAAFVVARQGLVLTLFFIGSAMSRDLLRSVGGRALAHGVVLWALVGSATLVAIRLGFIG
jgi:uncharacterized integral membrane protein (TIGR00698 family)